MEPVFTITVEILTTMQTAMSLVTPMVTLAVIMFQTEAGVAATTLMNSILTCAAPVQVEVNPLTAVTVTVTMTVILVVTVTLAVTVTVTTVPLTKK